jgi:hypothetical protein
VFVVLALIYRVWLISRVPFLIWSPDQHGCIADSERLAKVSHLIMSSDMKLTFRYWTSVDPDDPNSRSAMFFVVGYAIVHSSCSQLIKLMCRSVPVVSWFTECTMLSCTGVP